MYNSASTIRQGMKANTDAKVLKAKPTLNWTGPYKILAVGPDSAAEILDGLQLGGNLLYLDLPSDCPVRTLVGVWRLNPESPAPTPTTAGTCPNTYRWG